MKLNLNIPNVLNLNIPQDNKQNIFINMGITGVLIVDEIKSYLKHSPSIESFLETGTYLGDSTIQAAHVFKNVYSIELMDELYRISSEKCANYPNISLLHGDTLKVLPGLIKEKLSDKGVVWFVDAHQSGWGTTNNGIWVPLIEELNIILKGMSREHEHIFIFDDVRLFEKQEEGWGAVNIERINELFDEHDIGVKRKEIKNDRYIIYTKT